MRVPLLVCGHGPCISCDWTGSTLHRFPRTIAPNPYPSCLFSFVPRLQKVPESALGGCQCRTDGGVHGNNSAHDFRPSHLQARKWCSPSKGGFPSQGSLSHCSLFFLAGRGVFRGIRLCEDRGAKQRGKGHAPDWARTGSLLPPPARGGGWSTHPPDRG